MNWKEIALGDAIRVKHGYAFKGEFFSKNGTHLVVTPGNFHEAGGLRIREGKERFYIGEIPDDFILAKDDLIVAMTEQGEGLLGSSAWIPEDDYFLHNQRIGLISQCNEVLLHKRYLYWLFNTPIIRSQIRASATGAKVKHTAPERLYKVRASIPHIAEQHRISDALDNFDQNIALLQQQVSLLEEATRLIYTDWFVRLRFPGRKDHSQPSRGLPADRQVTTIGTISEYINRGVPPSYDETSPKWVVNQKCIRDKQLDMELARNLANEVAAEKWLRKGDVLINSTGTGTLGRIAQVREELDSVTVDTHVTIVRPKAEISPWFFGQQLLTMEPHFEGLGEGATNQTELKRDRIRDTSFLLPTPHVMAAFDEKVEPMVEQIEVLRKQITQLRQARDLLLPRLISGQLKL